MSHSIFNVVVFLLTMITTITTEADNVPLSLKLCTDWYVGSDLAMENYLKSFHLTELGQYVLQHANTTQVNWYLPQLLIDYHLSKFRLYGASFIGTSDALLSSNYGHLSNIGSNAQTVTTYPEMHELLTNCSKTTDPKQCLSTALKLDAFPQDQALTVYNINETYLDYLNVRMSNDSQSQSIAGYTTQSVQIRQAVIDSIPSPMFCYEPITDTNGTFCYPSCQPPVCGLNANCNKAYCANYMVHSTQPKYEFYFDFLHEDDYCVPDSDITLKTDEQHDDDGGCKGRKGSWEEFINYGTLVGFGAGLVFALLVFCMLKFCGFRCKKMETNFIADQLMRDGDSHYLL